MTVKRSFYNTRTTAAIMLVNIVTTEVDTVLMAWLFPFPPDPFDPPPVRRLVFENVWSLQMFLKFAT